MEDRCNMMNPFSPAQRYPKRPNPSPFSKKATPHKIRTGTKRNQKETLQIQKNGWETFEPTNAARPTITQPPPPQSATTSIGIIVQPPNTIAQA